MSKELIVSANRHETRVAVLEEDQVVEVYYQREKEYSLAGSIHKGRVTRVLPGMQSAFVDIGLDRDAFLYVSDFFEDNDEYDKIVTSVEEKVFKMDKVPLAASTSAPAPATVPAESEPSAEEPAAPVAAAIQPAPIPLVAPEQFARRNDNDRDQGRGGRRGRRRRPKGRGLPESKYFSPGHQSPALQPSPQSADNLESQPEAAAERTEDRTTDRTPDRAPDRTLDRPEDMMVLPGESLAKYRGEAIRQPEIFPEPEDRFQPQVSEPLAAEIPEFAATTACQDTAELAEVETPETFEIAAPQPPAPQPPAEAVQPESTPDLDSQTESDTDSTTDSDAEQRASSEGMLTSAEPSTGVEPTDEDQLGPEPARIPTSLTATLREQGGRFPHRVSRRMRRRGRPEGNDQPRTDAPPRTESNREPRPESNREPRPESNRDPRPTEVRQAPRPEPARAERPATPSISDLLREGQEIIVQIAKEPLGQKGARITSHIALPGRFLVYMPTVDHIGVSRKIPSDDERLRLKRVLQANRTGIPGGYIVRTAGDGRTEEELRADMMFLYNLWMDLRQKAEKRPAPLLVHHDLDVVERILRDQLTASFKNIWVDNEEVYENVLSFVQRFQPALVARVKLYTRPTPIFDEYGITSELEKALRPKVWLKTGGHIVINQTEALVAIDVNTGKYVGKSNRLEDTIVKTNTDAIKEIVRQIRLRDLGGIIVVDFIDMDERKNRQKVMQVLEEAMRSDRAPYKILQFNDFGLVAITRKRVKQSLERTLCLQCPNCEGSGYVKSPQTVIGEILVEAQKIVRAVEGEGSVMLRVNPEVAKVLKSNQNSYLGEIEEILGRTVLVKSDPLLHQEKFDLA